MHKKGVHVHPFWGNHALFAGSPLISIENLDLHVAPKNSLQANVWSNKRSATLSNSNMSTINTGRYATPFNSKFSKARDAAYLREHLDNMP